MKNKRNAQNEKIIDFHKLGAIIEKNFIVMTRDRIRIIPLLVMPIVMILVFGYISGNVPKHIPTAIIVYDNSPISQTVQQEIAGSEVFSVRHVVSTEGEGRRLLDQSKVRVLIEIPPNLGEDIQNNVQSGITVIVDESDSSVGATAKQALNVIVNKISYQLSMQKMLFYQQSVGSAAMELQGNYASTQSSYGLIAKRTVAAESSLKESKDLIDSLTDSLVSSLIVPIPLVIEFGQNKTMTYNNTYYFLPLAYEQTKSQILLLRASSGLVGAALNNINSATGAANAAAKQMELRSDYRTYRQEVIEPMNRILVFTRTRPDNILRPLVYEEKPAYGTGKRTVDFLIPSIIALTIFQGAVMGMGRSVAGEKREGSLTRVFLTPTSNATIIVGTLSFYILFEVCRSTFIILVSMAFFNIQVEGNILLIGLILMLYAGVSTSIGMILSSMVKTEQQFMAMAMLVSMPTMFLSGALFPLQAMPKFMQSIASFLPVTYGGDALRGVMIKGFPIAMVTYPIIILMIFLSCALALVFMVFKRDIE